MPIFTNDSAADVHAKPEPFCSFCLRECPANAEFYKHVIGSSQETRNSLQSMLGYEFNLANFAICKPCWKMMQLIQDFRLRCYKANEIVQRVSRGLSNADDGWFSAKNLATIENIRLNVQGQMQNIGKINVTRRALVLDDSTEEIEKKHHQTTSTNDDGETLKSEITIGETMVEPSDNVDTTSTTTETIHKCSYCHEILPSEAALSDHLVKHPRSLVVRCKMFCDMLFNTEEDRARHSRFCTERPQTCAICGLQLRSRQMWTIHCKQEHPDENIHACGTCGKRFRRMETLRSHVRIIHTENKRIFPCEVCGKMFSTVDHARFHTKKMHSNERVSESNNVLEE